MTDEATPGAVPDGHVRITRVFAAPRELVFEA
jgi:uncharacterized protein YndB with AHSA1/START domain